MSAPEARTAIETAAAIRAGELTAEQAVTEAIEGLEGRGRELNAVITVCADEAIARARTEELTGPLAGVPLLVKDLIDTAGIRTTYGSAIYRDHVPDRTAPTIAALEAAGAIIVGKAGHDEFAWGVLGQNEHYGDAVNPRHPGKVTGGSSGGSGAAVAAGLVPLSIGTDTGGSVRMPAGGCGIVGFKPPIGALSVDGVHPLAAHFDTVGPMAMTVADCALAYAVMGGTPVAEPISLEGVRVGVLTSPSLLAPAAPGAPAAERDPRADGLIERFRALGTASVTEIALPVPLGDTWPVFHADALAAHAGLFPERAEEYGRTIRRKLEDSARQDPAAAEPARAALRAWREEAARTLEVDVVVSPTLGVLELPPVGVDELEVRIAFSAYARIFSYLGWPALAIGGLQIAAPDAALVLGVGLGVEQAEGPLKPVPREG